VGIRLVEEEPAAWAPGTACALMVRSAHQGQLKMRCLPVVGGHQICNLIGATRREIARVHLPCAFSALLVLARSLLGIGDFSLALSGQLIVDLVEWLWIASSQAAQGPAGL